MVSLSHIIFVAVPTLIVVGFYFYAVYIRGGA